MSNDTGLAVGLKRGFIVTKREKRARPSQRKGVRDSSRRAGANRQRAALSADALRVLGCDCGCAAQKLGQKVALIREVVRDVVGYAPYERRIMELLKGGGSNPQK